MPLDDIPPHARRIPKDHEEFLYTPRPKARPPVRDDVPMHGRPKEAREL